MDDNGRQLEIVGTLWRQQPATAVTAMSLPRAWCGPALRKTAVAVCGFAVLVIGVALIFLPAPSLVVIPIGFAILAREFAWARRFLDWSKDRARRLSITVRNQLAKLLGVLS